MGINIINCKFLGGRFKDICLHPKRSRVGILKYIFGENRKCVFAFNSYNLTESEKYFICKIREENPRPNSPNRKSSAF